MDYADRARSAVAWFREGYRLQQAGELPNAASAYQRSIALYRTAEAHTFLGWTYSFQGRLDEAIAECRKAIEVDPDYGNPYNDIGCYLVQLGQESAAIDWLQRAKQAPRYAARCYPFFNLGAIFERQGRQRDALREYRRALELAPDYLQARNALARVARRLGLP
jgi:Tfp pilus assembly protein PilF